MPPKSSSATSSTRKKHARKAAGIAGLDLQPQQKKEKGEKGKKGKRSDPPRPKVYIAPVKPTAAVPDPLETTGLAHRLPAELVVVLRTLGKKAGVTKGKALEELQTGWISKLRLPGQSEDAEEVYTLLEMVPVWTHHLPGLLAHPSRKLRMLTASIHATMFRIPLLRDALEVNMSDTAKGMWALVAHDTDRVVISAVQPITTADPAFLERVLLDPDALYVELNPPAPAPAPAPSSGKGGKNIAKPTGAAPQAAPPARLKAEEQEENEEDRRARLRISALGALKTYLESSTDTPLPPFIASPALWSCLYHDSYESQSIDADNDAEEENDEEEDEYTTYAKHSVPESSFGHAQPSLRRAAWAVIPALLSRKPLPAPMVDVLARAVLGAAWVEPDGGVQGSMWAGLLGTVRDYPSSWALAGPRAYEHFRTTFLAKACGGAPVSAYPSVVVILSTIPKEILFPSDPLFESFWAALGEKAAPSLTTALAPARARAGSAFVGALLESAVFVARRARAGEGSEDGNVLLKREITRSWQALCGGSDLRLYADCNKVGAILRETCVRAGGVSVELLETSLAAISECIHTTCSNGKDNSEAELVWIVIKALAESPADYPSEWTPSSDGKLVPGEVAHRLAVTGRRLCVEVLKAAIPGAEDGHWRRTLIVEALSSFGGHAWEDQEVAQSLDALLANCGYKLLMISPPLLYSYLLNAPQTQRQSLYLSLLTAVASHPEGAAEALGQLVSPAASKSVQGLLAVQPGEDARGPLDALISGEDGITLPATLLVQILQSGERFLSRQASTATLVRVVSRLVARVAVATTAKTELAVFTADLDMLAGVLGGRPDALLTSDWAALIPAVWLIAFVLSRGSELSEVTNTARNLWLQWSVDAQAVEKTAVVDEIKKQCSSLISSVDVIVRPDDVIAVLVDGSLPGTFDLVRDVFPTHEAFDAMLQTIPSSLAVPSLAVLYPHLPPTDASGYQTAAPRAFIRIGSALLYALVTDRRAARDNVWTLQYIVALALYVEDAIALPASSPLTLETATSKSIVDQALQITTYVLTAATEQSKALTCIINDKPLVDGTPIDVLIVDLLGRARREDSIRDCRVLNRILAQILHNTDRKEAELWVRVARKVERTAPETCIAIISAVSASALEPPQLDRYRNELAADLMGVGPAKADTLGLLTLRKLAASAPDVSSDVVFLPQQRTVNVFKACQQWISSDEDINEEVESAMTHVFFYLATLVQNVPGTHWELIFDVVESNLENASLTEEDTLVSLARTLRLIILIQDLAASNKTLRANWEERHMQILGMVRDLAAGRLDDAVISQPRSMCRQLVLSIVQNLPPSLISEETLPKMCHLLSDPSADVQKMAYRLLQIAAQKHTEHLVIEAAVDAESSSKIELPLELLEILRMTTDINQLELLDADESIVFGYLLGWMVVFDLFANASLKIRLGYIDHLRALQLVGNEFIPNILNLLEIDQGIPRAFKLEAWAVDEYYVDFYEPGDSLWSLQVLAAHLYYRALLTVPSLIYNWVLDCKDRQLSNSIATYTSLHFSPVIIRAELAHVKSPEATAELADENLTVKVASNVNEVSAAYLVDEHQLEIKLKIPSDWPLHKIEVKDVQRVGVEETRWRAWILAVQQILWSQNGRIADGIGLFKKNVTGHFEGQVECAICYSIISVMDGTLPRKPCKTCKNRFHSGCLYKWFSTSHSSSCPLCRSDII